MTEEPVVPDPALPDPQLETEIAELAVLAGKDGEPRFALELARALERRRLPVAAFIYYDAALRADQSTEAVAGLVRIQDLLEEPFLIPMELNKYYDSDRWAVLPSSVLARVNVLIAGVDYRTGKLDEGLLFAEAVDPSAPVSARAKYLQGVILADPRSHRPEQALEAFQSLLADRHPEKQDDFDGFSALATLAMGRVNFGMGRYAEAARWYAKAKDLDEVRQEALFEGAYARFLNDEPKIALELLESRDVREGFVPEAPILEATIHLHEKDFDGARQSLARLERIHAMVAPLETRLNGQDTHLERLFEPAGGLAAPLVAELQRDRRLSGVVRFVRQVQRERAAVAAVPAWKASGFAAELDGYLGTNEVLFQKLANMLASKELKARWASVGAFDAVADLLRVELELGAGKTAAAAQALQRVIPKLEEGSREKADFLFELARLYAELGDEEHLREAGRLLDDAHRYARYDRSDEVLLFAGEIAERLHDRRRAESRYKELLLEFPNSPLANECRKRLENAH